MNSRCIQRMNITLHISTGCSMYNSNTLPYSTNATQVQVGVYKCIRSRDFNRETCILKKTDLYKSNHPTRPVPV